MIVCVIWVVLMMFWLLYGGYLSWDPAKPYLVGGTIIPWVCVLILGLILFGGITVGPIR